MPVQSRKKRRSAKSNNKLWCILCVGVTLILLLLAGPLHLYLTSNHTSEATSSLATETTEVDGILRSDAMESIPHSMDELHVVAPYHEKSSVLSCRQGHERFIGGEVLPENEEYSLYLPFSSISTQYYRMCIGSHDHQHTITVSLIEGECDVLASASNPFPTVTSWDWRINHVLHSSIAIHTYAEEFLASQDMTLYVAISSSKKGDMCKIGFKIDTFSNEELLHKLNNLRGGQVLLKRDLDKDSTITG